MRMIRKRRKARYGFSSFLSHDRFQSLLARNLFAVCFVCVVDRQPVEVRGIDLRVSVIEVIDCSEEVLCLLKFSRSESSALLTSE
jgi:hypothetical protein